MTQKIDFSHNVILRILAVVCGVWFLYMIRDVIALFLIAIIITASLYPIIAKITKRFSLSRAVTVTLVYLLFFAGVAALISFIIPTISNDLEQFIALITAYVGESHVLSSLFSVEDLGQSLSGSLGNVVSTTANLFTGVVSTVAVISMSFYMSLQEDGLKKSLLAITPAQHQIYVDSLISRIQESFGRWMAGQLVTMIFVGILYFIALSLLGVPYAALLAVLGGLLEIIPYFGPIMAAIPAIIVALPMSPFVAAMVGLSYLVINLLENQVLIPKIMNRAIGLNPVLVILALLIGGKIAGLVGLLLAVPLAGAIGVFIKDVIEKKIV